MSRPHLVLLQIFGRFLPLRSCGLLRLWLTSTQSAKYTKHWSTWFKSHSCPPSAFSSQSDWKWAQRNLAFHSHHSLTHNQQFRRKHDPRNVLENYILFIRQPMISRRSERFVSCSPKSWYKLYHHGVVWTCVCECTCAENAVPCGGVVLPCFGVEALVELHWCDHHHAKRAHHLKRETQSRQRTELALKCYHPHPHWGSLIQSCLCFLLHPLPWETFVSLHLSPLDSGWYWFAPVNPSKYSQTLNCCIMAAVQLTSAWCEPDELHGLSHSVSQIITYSTHCYCERNNNRHTYCFHSCDEVHCLLVDFLLQKTEPLVVEDETDGWMTKRSKECDAG